MRRDVRVLQFLVFLFLVPITNLLVEANASLISSVSRSPEYFNPSLGGKCTLRFRLLRDSTITAVVLDRDAFEVTRLADRKPMKAGENTLVWLGTDANGCVANGSYSFFIRAVSGSETGEYFPHG